MYRGPSRALTGPGQATQTRTWIRIRRKHKLSPLTDRAWLRPRARVESGYAHLARGVYSSLKLDTRTGAPAVGTEGLLSPAANTGAPVRRLSPGDLVLFSMYAVPGAATASSGPDADPRSGEPCPTCLCSGPAISAHAYCFHPSSDRIWRIMSEQGGRCQWRSRIRNTGTSMSL